jgi:sugar-specific transcriptional regulator TrmB
MCNNTHCYIIVYNMNTLRQALKELQLHEIEIAIYMSFLEKKIKSISDLAKHLIVSRKTLYVYLDSMMQRGLLIKTDDQWQVATPSVILTLLEIKTSAIQQTKHTLSKEIDDWEVMWQSSNQKPKIIVHRGRNNVLRIYDSIVSKAGKEMMTFGDTQAVFRLIGDEYAEHWIQRRKTKTKVKAIVPDNLLNAWLQTKDRLENREMKLVDMPSKTNAVLSMYADDMLIFLNPDTEEAIEINDVQLVTLLRNMFVLLWQK